MLELKNIVKKYDGVTILDDVSLDIQKGEKNGQRIYANLLSPILRKSL